MEHRNTSTLKPIGIQHGVASALLYSQSNPDSKRDAGFFGNPRPMLSCAISVPPLPFYVRERRRRFAFHELRFDLLTLAVLAIAAFLVL
jgi:hypothetical protein